MIIGVVLPNYHYQIFHCSCHHPGPSPRPPNNSLHPLCFPLSLCLEKIIWVEALPLLTLSHWSTLHGYWVRIPLYTGFQPEQGWQERWQHYGFIGLRYRCCQNLLEIMNSSETQNAFKQEHLTANWPMSWLISWWQTLETSSGELQSQREIPIESTGKLPKVNKEQRKMPEHGSQQWEHSRIYASGRELDFDITVGTAGHSLQWLWHWQLSYCYPE